MKVATGLKRILFCIGAGLFFFSGALPQEIQTRGPRHQAAPFDGKTAFNVVLGRPTGNSISLSLLSYEKDARIRVKYGTEPGVLGSQTEKKTLLANVPQLIELQGLQERQSYFYQVVDADSEAVFVNGQFSTRKGKSQAYSFTITADSHLDQNTDPQLYQKTLQSVAGERPDFHIDLGDTFMTEKFDERQSAAQQYLAQRFYFGEISHSVPVFLALGNHDGEEVRQWRGGAGSIGAWANESRVKYFPNPASSPLQDYFAWHWGDALFIVLNPYTYASPRRAEERWGLSLGETQYRWLQSTLQGSAAKYKLVFIHQLIGGINSQGRGGAEAVEFGEWGGNNADGTNGFKAHRPGWDLPIHDLLRRHRVSAVFHGHDHVYATQERDGIIYQEVPQPAFPGPGNKIGALAGGYKSGTILGNSGYMAVRVSEEDLQIKFKGVDGQTLHSYSVPAPPFH